MSDMDPLVETAIEAMADALYRLECGATGGLQAEKEWAIGEGLEWPTATTTKYYTEARAAFHAQNGVVRVVPIETTHAMIDAWVCGSCVAEIALSAANAAGDLTRKR